MGRGTARRVALLGLFVILGFPGIRAAEAASPRSLRKVTYLFSLRTLPSHTAPLVSVPKYMGYWQTEGLDVQVEAAGGSMQAAQMLVAGNADLFNGGVGSYLVIEAQSNAALIAVANAFKGNMYYPVVPADSEIAGLRGLKGKRIGVPAAGTGGTPMIRAAVKSVGLDPEKDLSIASIGYGAQAATALKNRSVDALAFWRQQYLIIENLGVKLRPVMDSPFFQHMTFELPYAFRKEYVERNPQVVVGALRGIAKGLYFSTLNPEAAIRIHWDLYKSKPPGLQEAEALRGELRVLNGVMNHYMPDPKRWGEMGRMEVEAEQDFVFEAGLLKQKLDPGALYTNKFIDEINKFDRKEIEEQARRFKMPGGR